MTAHYLACSFISLVHIDLHRVQVPLISAVYLDDFFSVSQLGDVDLNIVRQVQNLIILIKALH